MRTLSIRALASLLALLMLLSCSLMACDKGGTTTEDTTDATTGESTKAPETEGESNAPETEAPETGAPETEAPTEDETQGGDEPQPEIQVITIAEALELCGEPGYITTERFYIRGIIETM